MSMTIRELQALVYATALDKGWWDEDRTVGDILALIHSEVSEALEAYRDGHGADEVYYEKGDKPCGLPTELADVIIRCLDFLAHIDIDAEEVILAKHKYNEQRPYRHGGKAL